MTPCYIFDIDGTLADCEHRRHYVENSPKNWRAFYDECVNDPPIPHIVELCGTLMHDAHVLYVSGRPDRVRQQTRLWLFKYVDSFVTDDQLWMRKDKDFRDDTVVKSEILDQI